MSSEEGKDKYWSFPTLNLTSIPPLFHECLMNTLRGSGEVGDEKGTQNWFLVSHGTSVILCWSSSEKGRPNCGPETCKGPGVCP